MTDKAQPKHGDLMRFEYDGEVSEGTWIRKKMLWGEPKAEILSGKENVWVHFDDIICIVKRKEDRKTDLPLFSEDFRFNKGVGQ